MKFFGVFLITFVFFLESYARGEDTIIRNQETFLTQEERFQLHDMILSVVQANYGNIASYPGFDLAIRDFVHARITGEKNLNNFDLPDVFLRN